MYTKLPDVNSIFSVRLLFDVRSSLFFDSRPLEKFNNALCQGAYLLWFKYSGVYIRWKGALIHPDSHRWPLALSPVSLWLHSSRSALRGMSSASTMEDTVRWFSSRFNFYFISSSTNRKYFRVQICFVYCCNSSHVFFVVN